VGGNTGSVSNSYSTCNINHSSDENSKYLGGLVGHNTGPLSYCYATGDIIGGNGSTSLGGLVGHDNAGPINNCYATGNITCGNSSSGLGGLVGAMWESSISNCYSTGNVTGGSSSSRVGGLAGVNTGSISNCYSKGIVTGSSRLGGLIGVGSLGSTLNSYFLISSGPSNGYGTPLTDEEMKQQASFVSWDFNDVWSICETTNYPKLLWQILTSDIVCPDGVDIFDLAELCEQWLFEEIPADVAPVPSGDGIVDFADFSIFANQWGITNGIDNLLDFTGQWLKTGLPVCSADISPTPDGDGRVDAEDFAIMANDWLEEF
jgi:hypothetical protein